MESVPLRFGVTTHTTSALCSPATAPCEEPPGITRMPRLREPMLLSIDSEIEAPTQTQSELLLVVPVLGEACACLELVTRQCHLLAVHDGAPQSSGVLQRITREVERKGLHPFPFTSGLRRRSSLNLRRSNLRRAPGKLSPLDEIAFHLSESSPLPTPYAVTAAVSLLPALYPAAKRSQVARASVTQAPYP